MPNYAAIGRADALGGIMDRSLALGRFMREQTEYDRRQKEYGYATEERRLTDESRIDITLPGNVGDMVNQKALQEGREIQAIKSTAEERKVQAEQAQQETADSEKVEIKNNPFVAALEPFEAASKRLYSWANRLGFVQREGEREFITGRNLRIAKKLFAEDLEFRYMIEKDMLGDVTGKIAQMEQLLTPLDPSKPSKPEEGKDKDKPKLNDKQKEAMTDDLNELKKLEHYLFNATAGRDEEVIRWKATQKPATPKRLAESFPLANNMIQDKESFDGGITWRKVGVPYSRFAPKGGGKDPAKADIRRISGIKESIATLEKTDRVTMLMASLNPKLRKMVGQKIDPVLKAELLKQWNREIRYLERPEGAIPEQYRSTQGDIFNLFPED